MSDKTAQAPTKDRGAGFVTVAFDYGTQDIRMSVDNLEPSDVLTIARALQDYAIRELMKKARASAFEMVRSQIDAVKAQPGEGEAEPAPSTAPAEDPRHNDGMRVAPV